MNKIIIYIHGQGGSADEAVHYQSLFKEYDVVGLEYTSQNPWEANKEFSYLFDSICKDYENVSIIANSIGAYYSMCALSNKKIEKAFFISPVVDMQKLIENMMIWANVSEEELQKKGQIETTFGQSLSWKYLSYAKKQTINWSIPTHILYGENDNLTSFETISKFAKKINATLTVMKDGEHWFHTDNQMTFLDNWIISK